MFIKEFTASQVAREAAKVYAAAQSEPVLIRNQRGPEVVMVSRKKFIELTAKAEAK
jgi:PHD/YefM family antitoxin component YafN of YafNO toxin-antitoxin module